MRLSGDLMQQPTDWETAEEWYLDVQGKDEKDRRQVSMRIIKHMAIHNALRVT